MRAGRTVSFKRSFLISHSWKLNDFFNKPSLHVLGLSSFPATTLTCSITNQYNDILEAVHVNGAHHRQVITERYGSFDGATHLPVWSFPAYSKYHFSAGLLFKTTAQRYRKDLLCYLIFNKCCCFPGKSLSSKDVLSFLFAMIIAIIWAIFLLYYLSLHPSTISMCTHICGPSWNSWSPPSAGVYWAGDQAKSAMSSLLRSDCCSRFQSYQQLSIGDVLDPVHQSQAPIIRRQNK